MSKYTIKKLDKWVNKTICTNCQHLTSQVVEIPVDHYSGNMEAVLMYNCDLKMEVLLEANKGRKCDHFLQASDEVLERTKRVYNLYVTNYFDEDGVACDRHVLDGYSDEIVGHR